MTEQLQPMTAEQVKGLAARVVEFPPFDNGTPFMARVRRVSLLAMLAAGKVPNHLISIAWKALGKNEDMQTVFSQEDPEQIKEFFALFLGGVLVEPTWAEVREFLSDEQVSALLAYATQGARGLETFRGGQGGDASSGGSGEDVGSPSVEPDPGTG